MSFFKKGKIKVTKNRFNKQYNRNVIPFTINNIILSYININIEYNYIQQFYLF